MSLNIDLYKQRLDAYKVSGKDGKVDSMKTQLLNDFTRNPSYFDVLVNDVELGVHIITDKNKQYKVLCKPDEKIEVGNYVIWEGKTFLCTSTMEDDSVQLAGIIQKSNHTLKFIDSNNNLITKPCIVSAKTLYNTGIKDEKVIEIPNGMVGIQLPYDDDTKKLERGQDFVFNKTKYKLTFYNEVEFDGLVVLICDETELSHLDDRINGIADRWVQMGNEKVDRLPWLDDQESPIEPEEPIEPVVGITYTIIGQTQYTGNTDAEISFNQWCRYTIKKFVDGLEVEGSFIFTLTDTKATLSEITSDSCKVSVGNIYGSSTIKLIVTDEYTGMTAIEKEITIKGR